MKHPNPQSTFVIPLGVKQLDTKTQLVKALITTSHRSKIMAFWDGMKALKLNTTALDTKCVTKYTGTIHGGEPTVYFYNNTRFKGNAALAYLGPATKHMETMATAAFRHTALRGGIGLGFGGVALGFAGVALTMWMTGGRETVQQYLTSHKTEK